MNVAVSRVCVCVCVRAAWLRASAVQTDVNSNRPRRQQSSDAETWPQEEITTHPSRLGHLY